MQVNGVTRLQRFTFPLVNTGGLEQVVGNGAKYDTGIMRSPLATTGAIASISVECGNTPKPFTFDMGFVKARTLGTGAVVTAMDNKTVSSGSYVDTKTTVLWNPADYLKVGTRTSVPATSGNNCVVGIDMFDKYGS